jgi:hypothetical protein
MPVIAGVAIARTAPDMDAAKVLVQHMLKPETQIATLRATNFFPVIDVALPDDLAPSVQAAGAAVATMSASPDANPGLLSAKAVTLIVSSSIRLSALFWRVRISGQFWMIKRPVCRPSWMKPERPAGPRMHPRTGSAWSNNPHIYLTEGNAVFPCHPRCLPDPVTHPFWTRQGHHVWPVWSVQ